MSILLARRQRHTFLVFIFLLFVLVFITTSYLGQESFDKISNILPSHNYAPQPPPQKKPKYKDPKPVLSRPIVDNFPLALDAHSAEELPPIPSWVRPPVGYTKEQTPLFIGFTRNWRLLQQTVVSYITAGWPPEDIYVVENTGVMNSNRNGLLSLQNPFFLNHTRLHMLGVNILITPTLFTFAQLQNFYLYTSLEKGWEHYFWSHMDILALSYEDRYADSHLDLKPESSYSDFSSIYTNCVNELRKVTNSSSDLKWAIRFFSYDRLALVNVKAFTDVGGWDTFIPFYLTDCDMHERLTMNGWNQIEAEAGLIFDVASSLDDLIVLYRKEGTVEASFTDPNIVEEKQMKEAEEKEKQDKKEGGEKAKRQENPRIKLIKESESPNEFLPPSSNAISASSKWKDDIIGSPRFHGIRITADRMQNSKGSNSRGRNTWQSRQTGGQGEPFYRDSEGFENAIQMTIEHGRAVYREKWGHRDCDLINSGLGPNDAWKVKHDWD